MRRFDACALCLNSAREPVSCNKGHLFCKECVFTDLREPLVYSITFSVLIYSVTQKKDAKRQQAKLEVLKQEAEEEKARGREAARERVLLEFEKGQLGLAGKPTVGGIKSGGDTDEGG